MQPNINLLVAVFVESNDFLLPRSFDDFCMFFLQIKDPWILETFQKHTFSAKIRVKIFSYMGSMGLTYLPTQMAHDFF